MLEKLFRFLFDSAGTRKASRRKKNQKKNKRELFWPKKNSDMSKGQERN